jgi:hypothetical protein
MQGTLVIYDCGGLYSVIAAEREEGVVESAKFEKESLNSLIENPDKLATSGDRMWFYIPTMPNPHIINNCAYEFITDVFGYLLCAKRQGFKRLIFGQTNGRGKL